MPDPAYLHRTKTARPGQPLRIGNLWLKWTDLEEPAFPVTADTAAAARAYCLTQPFGAGDSAGFVVLHRCGAGFHFLLISLWRGNNELWQAVHYTDTGRAGFAPFDPAYPPPGQPRPTFCVWELGVVGAEQLAWQRFLRSDRSAAALAVWRDDSFAGTV